MLMLADPGRTTRKPKVLTLPRWTREVLKYAAVILVVAGAGGIYVSRMYDKFLLTGNTLTVPAGQHIDVQLPDGTKVCMNALSELHYPTFFIGRERKVQLKGEAFFDVSHDRKHPFVVETYACDVEVLGTKFNVKARSEDGEFVASLVEGKVRVTDRFNSNNQVEAASARTGDAPQRTADPGADTRTRRVPVARGADCLPRRFVRGFAR